MSMGQWYPVARPGQQKGCEVGDKEGLTLKHAALTCMETQDQIWQPKLPKTQVHNIEGLL